jgi:predicted dehydrogenase/threonine dehydrogenase-like Zn-dependent dehydrogenase
MKQLIQHIRSGKSEVVDVPAPKTRPGCIRVQLQASLVSAGTERMVVEFAEKNLFEKARSRPDLVRQTLDKIKREGLLATARTIQTRLDQPMALGYSAAGVIIDIGPGVDGFAIGDPVAAAGGGTAAHAEIVVVPNNLAVKVPHGVSAQSAAYTTLGAIALQGVRLANVKLGEIVGVIGLGLLGQLTVQILRAAGCRVIGYDPRQDRVEKALGSGAEGASSNEEAFASICSQVSGGCGVDAAIITAETPSNEPVTLAGLISRDKGVVVAVGAVGTSLPRKAYFEKELAFHISRSYGPGRYDAAYEEEGHDYPYGYVRWTENRNMQAFVQLLAEGKVETRSLTTHELSIDQGAHAYEIITGKTPTPFLGVVLTYPDRADAKSTRISLSPGPASKSTSSLKIGMLGAGNFATAVLLPIIKKEGKSQLIGICTSSGLSSRSAGDRFGFEYCSTDEAAVLNDPSITAVVIATRHNLHAAQTTAALLAGKNVFVEKPLCITAEELAGLRTIDALAQPQATTPILMVGFNRRFAPMAIELRKFFSDSAEPIMLHYRINAGRLPKNHWTQDIAQGGGRLIGEGVHFLDFAQWMCRGTAVSVHACALPDGGVYSQDNLGMTVTYSNGSVAQIQYLANGDRAAGKERIEAHGAGRSAVLDDFRSLVLVKGGRSLKERSVFSQDKGHAAEWASFADAVRSGKPSPIEFPEIDATMRTTFAALKSLESGQVETVT